MKKSTALNIAIILILLVSAVFLYAQNQSLEKEIVILNTKIFELEKKKTESAKPEPIIENIPEGWKEYIDEEYKFRVWYPEEFTDYGQTAEVRLETSTKNYSIRDNRLKTIQIYMPLTDDIPVGLMAIYIYNDTQDMNAFIIDNLSQFIEDINDTNKYIKSEKINDMVFSKVYVTDTAIKYYIKKNNYIYKIESESTIGTGHPDQKTTFDKMIKSFKFIE